MNEDYHHKDDTASRHVVDVSHSHIVGVTYLHIVGVAFHLVVGVACSLGVQPVQDQKAFEGEIDKRIQQLGWDEGGPGGIDRGRQHQQM